MIKLIDVLNSSNTNVKKLIFEDETALTESVIYKYPDYETRTVLCVSVQSGCKVGCSFCGTGKKFLRNLTSDEIVKQVVDTFKLENINTINVQKLQIMFMSMGEPSHNWFNLKQAIIKLNELYPNAQLLISTIGTNTDDFMDEFINLSMDIDEIGLQFSIHHHNDSSRNKLIPYKDKLSLLEISDFGTKWYKSTFRKPFCNYVVTESNKDGYENLFDIFDPNIFNFTFSVLCNTNENMKHAFNKNKHDIKKIHDDFLSKGYNVHIFDPAGQDDIGGGCGQLWYFQNKKV